MKIFQTVVIAGSLLASASAMAQPAPYLPIPPLQVEIGAPPPPPGPPSRYVLEPGHWQWDGARYVWVGRHWIGRVGGHWHPGGWKLRHGGWVWVPAHWGR